MNIYNEIIKTLKENGAKGALTKETKFSSIGIDSLDLMDLIVKLEDALSIRIPDEKLTDIYTINDLLNIIEELKK